MIDTYMQPKKCTIKMDAHNYIKLNKKNQICFSNIYPEFFLQKITSLISNLVAWKLTCTNTSDGRTWNVYFRKWQLAHEREREKEDTVRKWFRLKVIAAVQIKKMVQSTVHILLMDHWKSSM